MKTVLSFSGTHTHTNTDILILNRDRDHGDHRCLEQSLPRSVFSLPSRYLLGPYLQQHVIICETLCNRSMSSYGKLGLLCHCGVVSVFTDFFFLFANHFDKPMFMLLRCHDNQEAVINRKHPACNVFFFKTMKHFLVYLSPK